MIRETEAPAFISNLDQVFARRSSRFGGAGRDRTDDLRLAKAALPQLSYSPVGFGQGLVGLSGFEPLTSRLSAVRSNQLSYRPGNNRSESNLKMLVCECRGCSPGAVRAPEVPGDGTLKTRQARNCSSPKVRFEHLKALFLRKEVIQPQVLLQLPCYDFTPITDHTVGACPPCGLAQRLLVQPAFVM